MSLPLVKICGLSTLPTLEAALDAGADMVGFVFFRKSPRHVSLETARMLGEATGERATRVALTVDADDSALEAIVAALDPGLLQLHGKESPTRVAAIRARFGLPVMKAVGVASAEDLKPLPDYATSCDLLLIDAKPPPGGALPGGNGLTFDWRLVEGLDIGKPWLLSGGLDAGNVAEALKLTGAWGADVSSGVESAPGVKDEARIAAFVRAAKSVPVPRDRLA